MCSLAGSLVSATIDVIAGGAEGVIAAAQAPSLRQALARLVYQLVIGAPGSTWTRPASRSRVVRHRHRARAPGGRSSAGAWLAELGGSDEKGVVVRDIFTFAPDAQGDGSFGESGVIPRVVGEFAARGIKVDPNIFKRAGR